MTIIDIEGLRKEYTNRRSTVVAVEGLDLQIDGPGVYGFLGPNGSGKTTTIRCLLGLVRPSAGNIRLFGTDATNDLQSVIHRVGALVETPKFFPTFSARRNLNLLGGVAGISKARVDECIDIVGLSDRATDDFGSYSLGMKQRLAVAATLLRDPDLLILDEPANGLDPAGIVEIRQLIRQLGASGKAVFVSSHQLAEVQQTCDWAAIIRRGELLRSGTMQQLASAGRPDRLLLTIEDPQAAIELLTASGFVADLGPEPETVAVEGTAADGSRINQTLAEAGRYLRAMAADKASLESAFLEITGDEGGAV